MPRISRVVGEALAPYLFFGQPTNPTETDTLISSTVMYVRGAAIIGVVRRVLAITGQFRYICKFYEIRLDDFVGDDVHEESNISLVL